MVRGSWYNFNLRGVGDVIRVKLSFNTEYVNNAYGDEAQNPSTGWANSKKGGHTFGELLGSDGATIAFYDGAPNRQGEFSGSSILHAKFDYIGLLRGDGSRPEHYAALWLDEGIDKNDSKLGGGKKGGDSGDSLQRTECVLNTDSSLAQNLRKCASYHSSSRPLVSRDKDGNAHSAGPYNRHARQRCAEWVHEVIYYVDLDPNCFRNFQGGAVMTEVHASPNAGLDDYEEVQWEECVW
jgi:hypothetical protein